MFYRHCLQYDRAEPLAREAVELAQKLFPADSPPVASALATHGLILVKARKYAEAEPVLRQCLTIREAKQSDDWMTFNTQSLLGGSLLGQGKYAEAEPLLLQGYEGMKQRAATIPATGKMRLVEAIERIVQLYEATGRPELAREWRAKLPPVVAPPPRPAVPKDQ